MSSVSPKSFLCGNYSESVFLTPTTKEEIIDISKSFQPGKAPGFDGVEMTWVKQEVAFISEPLSYRANLSFSCGVVPDSMKIARVIPVFEKEDPLLFTNYRPISILPCFSKFLERVVYNRPFDFINQKGILFMNQYGFRKQHYTCLAMLQQIENVTSALDRKKLAIGVFLDLSKAFGTVNHEILFEKLHHYGIHGIAPDWVKKNKEIIPNGLITWFEMGQQTTKLNRSIGL